MATSRTKPSTRRLSEVARHVVIPSGIVSTGWPNVCAQARELGFNYDGWQDGAGRLILGKRADGKYAATVGGVVLSIPRQVGKTFFIGSLVMVLCIVFPGLKVIWTAHRTRTTTTTFRSMQGMARRKKVSPHIRAIRTANGEQEISFRNGSLIMFGAREQGFGRGFDEIDIEVFDEAQILTEKALEDMVAATNQTRHPHGALLFFMGTPPRPVDPGEVFAAKRRKALAGKSKDLVYIECSADRGADPDDRSQWARANPSYPHRTPLESMLRLRENLPSEDSWRREALGVWDEDTAGGGMFKPSRWAELESAGAVMESVSAFAVEAQIDWATSQRRASIAAAGPAGGKLAVELVDRRWGTDWVVARLVELAQRHGTRQVVFDDGGGAADLIPAARAAGLEVDGMSTKDVAAATAGFIDAMAEMTVVHGPQAELDDAIRAAKPKAYRDGGFLLSAAKSETDLTPLKAAILAHWRARQAPKAAPEVWSIAEMVEELRREQAGKVPGTATPPQARPDGSTFIPL